MSDTPYTSSEVVSLIKSPIRVIVELGCSRYLYTRQLVDTYSPDVLYAFEPNPNSKDYCSSTEVDSRVIFVPKAVSDYDGTIDLIPFIGIDDCSSTFTRVHRKEEQGNPITVECTRLDTFLHSVGISHIDLLCMDIQGSELNALRGLGVLLKNVSYIVLEMPYPNQTMHQGAPSYEDYMKFFDQNELEVLHSSHENDWECNVLVGKKHR